MPREIRINYLYGTPITWERFDLACEELGWANKSLVQQCLQAFFKKNREFYVKAGYSDADARGLIASDYYRLLRDEPDEALPRYTKGRPGFGVTPLDEVDLVPTDKEGQRRYNVINLSRYNYVLFKVATIVDTGPTVQLVSRIVQQHFDIYWDSNYWPQIERDRDCRFE